VGRRGAGLVGSAAAALLRPGVRVALALPVHGAVMLTTLLLTMTRACAVPVNPEHTEREQAAEMAGCQVHVCMSAACPPTSCQESQVELVEVKANRDSTGNQITQLDPVVCMAQSSLPTHQDEALNRARQAQPAVLRAGGQRRGGGGDARGGGDGRDGGGAAAGG
jgi:acyl-CoA synthetase (AMP-forming)/AMP-acid ligase II